MSAKQYYANPDTLFPYALYPINYEVAKSVLKMTQYSCFEFGCHDGRNLDLIKFFHPSMEVAGMDINAAALNAGRIGFGLTDLRLGDEKTLNEIGNYLYDVVFTSSVLCHIDEGVGDILRQMIRISRNGTLLVETQEPVGAYYYQHDYAKHGFTKFKEMKSVDPPRGNGSVYEFWWRSK